MSWLMAVPTNSIGIKNKVLSQVFVHFSEFNVVRWTYTCSLGPIIFVHRLPNNASFLDPAPIHTTVQKAVRSSCGECVLNLE